MTVDRRASLVIEKAIQTAFREIARLLATSDGPLSTVANCCQNGALCGCPKNRKGFVRDIGKITKWQLTPEFSGFSSVFFKERATIPSAGDSGRCRSVFRGMPITGSGMMAITVPG